MSRLGILAGDFFAFMSRSVPIRMWRDLEGKLDVPTAALATVLIALPPGTMVVMERLAGLSRRTT
jgi:putative spermidine/putrescine transport system permease protein